MRLLSLGTHHVLSRYTAAFLKACCANLIVQLTTLAPFGHKPIKVWFIHLLNTFCLLQVNLSKLQVPILSPSNLLIAPIVCYSL